ncbi:MAG: phosphopentomutase [Opitutales bacterium]|nr:phosphopentomutase [Opitutales bacterium]
MPAEPRILCVVVIDSFGMGALPDAASYGDAGAHTAAHQAAAVGGARWPLLTRWGLGNAAALRGDCIEGVSPAARPEASFGLMAGRSPGKDTVTGHWELAGVVLDEPLKIFPPGPPAFPPGLLAAFRTEFGTDILGDCAASGTEIIQRLGDEHCRRGHPIVYTSADSVVQIAAHEAVAPVERLYAMCAFMRERCDALRVGRVIARPFEGGGGDYRRTARRRDFAMAVPGVTVMDPLRRAGVRTVAVGKIGDIFNHEGFDTIHPDKGNAACLDRLEALLRTRFESPAFVFVNLVDTDMVYGHRRDPRGYHGAVAEIDARLAAFAALLRGDDRMIITADHGCDPCHPGTDHTREYVPILVYGPGHVPANFGIRATLADLAQSLAAVFGAEAMTAGTSFRL